MSDWKKQAITLRTRDGVFKVDAVVCKGLAIHKRTEEVKAER